MAEAKTYTPTDKENYSSVGQVCSTPRVNGAFGVSLPVRTPLGRMAHKPAGSGFKICNDSSGLQ